MYHRFHKRGFLLKIRVLLLSFFILFFYGCKGDVPPVPVSEFTASAVVYVGDSLQDRSEFQARVVSSARGVLCVTLTSPRELAGLCCKWGDGFEMSYNDLCLKGEGTYLPDFSFQRVIYDVLEDLSKNPPYLSFKDGVATFEGRIPAGAYKALTDGNGYINKISVKEINLKIEFSYKE